MEQRQMRIKRFHELTIEEDEAREAMIRDIAFGVIAFIVGFSMSIPLFAWLAT